MDNTLVAYPPVLVQPQTFVWWTDFLPESTNRELYQYAVENESLYEDATTSGDDPNYRIASVLHHTAQFGSLMVEKLYGFLPQIYNLLGISPFPIEGIETQITMHGTGGYYRAHNDSGHEGVQNRVISYVYYFHAEPKPFTGGELALWNDPNDKVFVPPDNNTIVFFPSGLMHEVLPVTGGADNFWQRRGTLNGWIRRK